MKELNQTTCLNRSGRFYPAHMSVDKIAASPAEKIMLSDFKSDLNKAHVHDPKSKLSTQRTKNLDHFTTLQHFASQHSASFREWRFAEGNTIQA
jgi:hypothetical protein